VLPGLVGGAKTITNTNTNYPFMAIDRGEKKLGDKS
jgi:hypothetical protein